MLVDNIERSKRAAVSSQSVCRVWNETQKVHVADMINSTTDETQESLHLCLLGVLVDPELRCNPAPLGSPVGQLVLWVQWVLDFRGNLEDQEVLVGLGDRLHRHHQPLVAQEAPWRRGRQELQWRLCIQDFRGCRGSL